MIWTKSNIETHSSSTKFLEALTINGESTLKDVQIIFSLKKKKSMGETRQCIVKLKRIIPKSP